MNTTEELSPHLTLQNPCPDCKQQGYCDDGTGYDDRCDLCNGAGFIPTPFGEMILDLVRNNMPALLNDARRE